MRAELSREEKLNVLTHGVMAAAFIIWMCIGVPQTWAAQGTVAGVGILIFFLCMICMFTASALYHAMPAGSAAKDVLHIFDHICIYLAIAGSYTPAVIAIMDGWMKIGLLVFQWGMVIIDIFYKIFAKRKNSKLSLAIYLCMGWSVIILLPQLIQRASLPFLLYVAAGGIAYSVGAFPSASIVSRFFSLRKGGGGRGARAWGRSRAAGQGRRRLFFRILCEVFVYFFVGS